ncbi:MAG: phosphatidate cytidylyltransferase [Rhodoferax sp.]|nr:phosphatidate cytidylyltransferase [Rhodoferax sp.]
MLKQRIITALVLLAILIPAVFYPASEAFAAVALVLISAAAWEWARLNHTGMAAAFAWGALCGAVCIASWWLGLLRSDLQILWLLLGASWVLAGGWLLVAGVQAWSGVPKALRLIGGVLGLWGAWLAVVQARILGINFLFSVLVLVWAADVFAYFAGRALGGHFFARKLAPTISPGKTWEGALGGLLGVLLCGFVWRALDAHFLPDQVSLYTRLAQSGSAFMVLCMVFLSAMSIVGDLVESLFKRSAGVKDSSALLPGHGGVLDRIDALLPVLPLAMMLATK